MIEPLSHVLDKVNENIKETAKNDGKEAEVINKVFIQSMEKADKKIFNVAEIVYKVH